MRFVVPVAAVLSCVTAVRAEAAESTVPLEGVKAEVRAPKGSWPRAAEVPQGSTGGQWRIVFRGEKAQCEARVFPVQSVEAAQTVLWQAADKISRQVKGSAFGLPSVRTFVLDGHDAAESEFWVQSGTAHLEGRIRLLRASPQSWALAWGLAAPEAEAAARDAVVDFPGTLVPSEPAFFEPALGEGDAEEVLVQAPDEPPLTRRHLQAVLALVEAGAGVRFSRAGRLGLVDALAAEARTEGPRHREALRTGAEAYAETLGLGAEPRAAAREQLGKRVLESARARSDAGKGPAQLLLGTIAQGRLSVAGTAEDGLTRFEAETWLDACALLASLAADAQVPGTREQRETERAGLATAWTRFDAAERAAARSVARLGADVALRWGYADAAKRFAFRAATAAALLPTPPAPVPPPPEPPAQPVTGPTAPADPKTLRALLDARARDPELLLHAACSLAPSAQARLFGLLIGAPPGDPGK